MTKITQEIVLTGIVLDENNYVTLSEIQDLCHIEEEILLEMIEQGLLEPVKKANDDLFFDTKAIARVHTALYLRSDLGVNIPGAALAIELLEEMNNLRNELEVLRRLL